jgi:outer membrane PBP1 activator LpoA protein
MNAADLTFSADAASLAKLRQSPALVSADMVFLALDAAAAGKARPFLGNTLALYGTSRINGGNAASARALSGVRFTDMPWLLQPDHAAVMIYPRAQFGDAVDFERLYAFGIDAFRLGLELLKQTRDPAIDGVTGRIRVAADQQFVREAAFAQFSDGKSALIGEAR